MRSNPWHSLTFLILLFGLWIPTASAQTSGCDDLSDVDFGACAMPLGVGIVNGQCQSISGCESPVPLFVSFEACESSCPTCSDVSSIDFGPCEAILGFGVVGTTCQLITGCESPVPLFATLVDCQMLCTVVGIDERSWGLVKRLYRSE